jgi:hypothetical protein
MVTRIGVTDDSARWAAHIAWMHLRMDRAKLAADLAAPADDQTIASDRAALTESRNRVGTRLVDVTV